MRPDRDAAGEAPDLLLVGGGLANGLIAWRLKQRRPELRVRLLEAGPSLGGNHTWSFHDTDITPAQHEWMAPLVSHRWPSHEVFFPRLSRTVPGGYCSIVSERFDEVLRGALGPACDVGRRATAVAPTQVMLDDGSVLRAGAVIDGRGVTDSPCHVLGYQKFLGQVLQLRVPHGLASPVLMDARVSQDEGYRFVYLLPFTSDTVLVEDTVYADDAQHAASTFRHNIAQYAEARGWQVLRVVREEQGVLPITLDGDAHAFWSAAGGQPRAGLAAGLFHPTTGYSLPEAVRLADLIAELPDLNAQPLFAAIERHALGRWKSQRFFRILNRMLFQAASPATRRDVMQKFYQLPPPLIRRFYAARPTVADKLRILSGKPPVPLMAALRASRGVRIPAAPCSP